MEKETVNGFETAENNNEFQAPKVDNGFETQEFTTPNSDLIVNDGEEGSVVLATVAYALVGTLATFIIAIISTLYIESFSIYIGVFALVINIMILSGCINLLSDKLNLHRSTKFKIATGVVGVFLFTVWLISRTFGFYVSFGDYYGLNTSESIELALEVMEVGFIDSVKLYIETPITIVSESGGETEFPVFVWYISMLIAFAGFVFPSLISKFRK